MDCDSFVSVFGSATGMQISWRDTRIARDPTAPQELAVAAALLSDEPGIEPPGAAETLAGPRPGGGGVAGAALGAEGSADPVRLAEIGRLLRVDEVASARPWGWSRGGDEVPPVVARDHPGGRLEAPPQRPPHGPEGRQPTPAATHRARAGETVALALRDHEPLHSLQ